MQKGFKMLDSKACPQQFPKPPKFCTYCFSYNHHRWIVLKFGDKVVQKGSEIQNVEL